ncbi:hypothetical protein AnigIFM62618_009356 [Aspergillus niger]|nr:hypothetical protein AnigIFM62618_009356 [Aspergillus niger]
MLPTPLSPRINLDPNVDDTIISVNITNECITAYKELLYKRGADKPAFVIYKISDDERSIVVKESSPEKNYEAFLQKLTSAHDSDGKPAPRYAIYDVEYDLLEDGRRATIVFISWMPDVTSTRIRMLYASTKEQLRKALDVKVSIHADDVHDIEWKTVLREASAKTVQHNVALIIGAYIEKGTHYNPLGHIRECGIRCTKITRNDGL